MSLSCTEPTDPPESTSYAWDISHAPTTTYHPYCHSLGALTKYLKEKLRQQWAKRLSRSLPAQVKLNIPLRRNTAATNESLQKEYQDQLHDHEFFMLALQNHNAVLTVLDGVLEHKGWPDLEPAERQSIILSRVEKQFLHSSSKRCREAAAESEGTTLPKRNR